MKKTALLLVFLTAFSFLAVSHDYANEHTECWEETMCHQPEQYSDVDFMDEVYIEGGMGELWNGTIEIQDVTYMHNVSEKVANGSFQEKYTEQSQTEDSVDKIVSFDGVMKAESLCNEPVFDVDIEDSVKYTLNIEENDTYGVRSCYEHPVRVEYTLNLNTHSTDLKAIVNQNNVTESFQTEDYHGLPRGQGSLEEEDEEETQDNTENSQSESRGFLSGVLGFFSNLF